MPFFNLFRLHSHFCSVARHATSVGLQMATELFTIWGFQTGWLSEHGNGYAVSAELDGQDL